MRDAQQPLSIYDTTIGKKAVMAVTGLVLYGFVIAHMLGNLQVFMGPQALNEYAEKLKSVPPLLWGTRGVLVLSFVLHTHAAVSLTVRSEAARPVGYRRRRYEATTIAGSTMKYGGVALLLFVIFHIAHFTFPGLALGAYRHSATDVYANLVNGFSVGWVALVYLVAQAFLGLHVYHGAASLFQTLGLAHPRYERLKTVVPRGIGLGVAFGNVLIVLAVYAGVVR